MSLEARSVLLGEMLDLATAKLHARNEARMEEAVEKLAAVQRERYTDEGVYAPDEEYSEHGELDGTWGDAGC